MKRIVKICKKKEFKMLVAFSISLGCCCLGDWSSLEAVLSFKRLNGFYLIQVLAPINILVILSWVSFLIQPNHAPARVFLGISCVLAMASIQTYINNALPKVNVRTLFCSEVFIILMNNYIFETNYNLKPCCCEDI